MKTQHEKSFVSSTISRRERNHIVNSMKMYVKKILPEIAKVQTTFTGKQLNSCFKTEDRTKFEHQHDIIY